MVKYRDGFVSNSSSSSFVVVIPNKDNLPKDELILQLKSDFEWQFECYEEDGSCKDEVEKMLKIIDQGKMVKVVSVEYGGEESVRDVLDLLDVEYWEGED